jgi:hypothetical protein
MPQSLLDENGRLIDERAQRHIASFVDSFIARID